jgi:hypothetical protein
MNKIHTDYLNGQFGKIRYKSVLLSKGIQYKCTTNLCPVIWAINIWRSYVLWEFLRRCVYIKKTWLKFKDIQTLRDSIINRLVIAEVKVQSQQKGCICITHRGLTNNLAFVTAPFLLELLVPGVNGHSAGWFQVKLCVKCTLHSSLFTNCRTHQLLCYEIHILKSSGI